VAIGGGSSMDTAKGIGVVAAHDGSILDYEWGRSPIKSRIPPMIAVPTTAGTGSEVTLWAVITDHQRQIKFNVGGTGLIGAWMLDDLDAELRAIATVWEVHARPGGAVLIAGEPAPPPTTESAAR
jgi:choline dehydrogenase